MNCVCVIADVDFDAGKPRKLQNVSGFLHTCLWYHMSLKTEPVSDEPISIPQIIVANIAYLTAIIWYSRNFKTLASAKFHNFQQI